MSEISTDQSTPIIASTSGELWKINADVTVQTQALAIDASGTVTGLSFIILGTLNSVSGPVAMQLGSAGLANCDTSIRIDTTDEVSGTFRSGGKGIVALSGGVSFLNLGTFETVATGLDFRGNGNQIENDASMISSTGSLIVSAGIGDSISNLDGSMTAHGDTIVSTGRNTRITNDASLSSTHGMGVVSKGIAATITNSQEIDTYLEGIFSSGARALITNSGTIGSSKGAAVQSAGNKAVITNSGEIDGKTYGLLSTGNGVTINNYSTISATGTALMIGGDNAIVTSTALLSGKTALMVTGNGAVITNTNEIDGLGANSAAIRVTSSGETAFTNRGAVHAESGVAFQSGSGAEKVLNTGSLYGDVKLGAGNDWFSAMKGEVTGEVYGGKGDDVYVVGIELKIVEKPGEGTDTIQSKYSWTLGANLENLELLGKGNMDATGNRLDNIITGNRGTNHLTGGGGGDIFVFEKNFGKDIITDFTDGKDRIDFSDYPGAGKFADIASHMRQSGDDVVIDFGAHAKLTVEDIHKSDLTAADFLF